MERKIVNGLREAGIQSQRIPLSGSAGGLFAGDLKWGNQSLQFTAEVKARRDGWKTIRNWLDRHEALFLVADHKDPLVVLPWHIFLDLFAEVGILNGVPGSQH